jgi:hypothetical protein
LLSINTATVARDRKYCSFDDVHDSAYKIHLKEAAPALLSSALGGVPLDVVATGDRKTTEERLEVSQHGGDRAFTLLA